MVPARELATQGITPDAARWRTDHRRLVRALQGSYLLGVDHPDLLDRARAALSVSPPGAVVGFHTAAALLGFGVVEDEAVHVVVPSGTSAPYRRGLRVHQAALSWDTPVICRGVPCTPAARTAVDLARLLPRAQGLSILDAVLFAGACTMADLGAEVARHEALPGIRKARPLVPLADHRPECAQESHLRLVVHDGGLTGFEPQVEVADEWGVVRYRLDLADTEHRVAAEYDGASHNERVSQDRARHNWLVDRGWTMRYFTKDDLYRRPETIVPLLRRALNSAPRSWDFPRDW